MAKLTITQNQLEDVQAQHNAFKAKEGNYRGGAKTTLNLTIRAVANLFNLNLDGLGRKAMDEQIKASKHQAEIDLIVQSVTGKTRPVGKGKKASTSKAKKPSVSKAKNPLPPIGQGLDDAQPKSNLEDASEPFAQLHTMQLAWEKAQDEIAELHAKIAELEDAQS
jgi:hypothetical protein